MLSRLTSSAGRAQTASELLLLKSRRRLGGGHVNTVPPRAGGAAREEFRDLGRKCPRNKLCADLANFSMPIEHTIKRVGAVAEVRSRELLAQILHDEEAILLLLILRVRSVLAQCNAGGLKVHCTGIGVAPPHATSETLRRLSRSGPIATLHRRSPSARGRATRREQSLRELRGKEAEQRAKVSAELAEEEEGTQAEPLQAKTPQAPQL